MTAPTPQSKAEATLRALRVRYRSESWQTVNLFRRLATELQATPELADALQRLRKEAHRVHGTAGSYGFRRASALAEALEGRALRWIADPALDRERRGAAVEEFTRDLERSFAEEA
jgi:HPt (histidine-containing phosphotransfer) domain-containing protein